MKNLALEHCAKCASYHIGMAKAHRAAEKETDGAMAEFHKTAADLHIGQGEHHLAMCEKLKSGSDAISTNDDSQGTDSLKVFGMPSARDYKSIRPDAVHGVLPDIPAPTLVPRHGSAPINKAAVPEEFKDLVATE